MGANLFRVDVILALLAVLAVMLSSYVAQRLWYRLRTAQLREVDTMPFRWLIEGFLTLFAAALIVFCVAGWSLLAGLRGYQNATPGTTLKEYDVTSDDPGRTSMYVYNAQRGAGERLGIAEALIEGPAPRLWVQVHLVRFTGFFRWIGQPDLILVEASSLREVPNAEQPEVSWLHGFFVRSERQVAVFDVQDSEGRSLLLEATTEGVDLSDLP